MKSDSLFIKNATLPRADGSTDILVENGEIAGIGDGFSKAESVVDAEGGLVTPAFVDCHTHLDKAMVFDDISGDTGTLQKAIDVMRERKEQYSRDDVQRRAEEAIRLHIEHGCNSIRTHVDVDTVCGLTGLEGVKKARDTYDGITDIEIVAFPQEGLLTGDGSEDLIREALDNGADVVGGIPALEASDEDGRKHIDILLDIAERYDVPVDMHIDETDDPASRTLEYLAVQAKERGLDDGQVTASHACALAAYPDDYAQQVIGLVAESEINIVTNPATNLLLQGRDDQYPKHRGITRVTQLCDADVTVAAGQDNMQDGFYPYGKASMLEVAWLLSHVAHMDTRSEQDAVLDMVTRDASGILAAGSVGLFDGADASLNVFPSDITSVTAVLRASPQPRYSIYKGSIVDR